MMASKALSKSILLSMALLLSACGGGGGGSSENTSSAAPSPTPAPQPTPATPESLQEIADSAAQSVDAILIYVDRGGNDPISVAAGNRERNSQTPVHSDDLFKIASISKLYIAVAATKLANEGSINLSDTLQSWLPDIGLRIANAESITIQQLIQHRSGVPDFDSQPGFSWQNPHTSIDATLEFALDKPADFAPDNRFEYSNTNYLLLAKVMDAALGFSHQLYIRSSILEPLLTENTFLEFSQIDDESRLISGYWENLDRKQQDYVIPGGSMVATAADVGEFIRALNTGDLLLQNERQLYPYWFNHSGWLPGYQSQAQYYSDIDAVVVQFVSSTGGGSEATASRTLDQVLAFLRN